MWIGRSGIAVRSPARGRGEWALIGEFAGPAVKKHFSRLRGCWEHMWTQEDASLRKGVCMCVEPRDTRGTFEIMSATDHLKLHIQKVCWLLIITRRLCFKTVNPPDYKQIKWIRSAGALIGTFWPVLWFLPLRCVLISNYPAYHRPVCTPYLTVVLFVLSVLAGALRKHSQAKWNATDARANDSVLCSSYGNGSQCTGMAAEIQRQAGGRFCHRGFKARGAN